jgi:hypothetical protein
MIAQLPEDILLEIITLIESDVQTLRSCALTSRAWARDCQPYIFRTVNFYATRHPESTYNKLYSILKENPSLADYTRELHLAIEDVESEKNKAGDKEDPADYAQFLGWFNRLEKVSFKTQDFDLGAATRDSLVDALARVFELETLRTLILIGFELFPTSLLARATHVTDLWLHPCHSIPDNQLSPIAPSRVQNNRDPASVCARIPIFLALTGHSWAWSLYPFAALARERRGIFESRYIDKLVLAPSYGDGNSADVIEPCCELLRAVGATQQGVECLSHFELKSGECLVSVSQETLHFIDRTVPYV